MNSRPLGTIPHYNDEGIEVLTPGHFLIGRPIEAIPDRDFPLQSISTLRRWHLCEALVCHFWKRWHSEYLTIASGSTLNGVDLSRIYKLEILSCWEEKTTLCMPSQWPMARIIETHEGQDGLVRVVKLRTTNGIYMRPVTKTALLLPCETCTNWLDWLNGLLLLKDI